MKRQQFSNQELCPKGPSLWPEQSQFISWNVCLHFDTTDADFARHELEKVLVLVEKWIFIYRVVFNAWCEWQHTFARKHALEIRHTVVVPSSLDKHTWNRFSHRMAGWPKIETRIMIWDSWKKGLCHSKHRPRGYRWSVSRVRYGLSKGHVRPASEAISSSDNARPYTRTSSSDR